MANFGHNFILVLICVVILLHSINCKPNKRSATDCYGTDCIIPQEQLDFPGNPRETMLLENITGSMIHAFPEITDLLKNIVHIHQNTTVPALPLITKSLEDDKDLQASQNHLIENGTAVTTPILLEMVRLMKSQQAMQERHNQQMQERMDRQYQNQQAMHERHNQQMQERVDRQYQLLANQQAMQERHYQWMQHQSETQSTLLENFIASLHQTFLPLLTNLLQIQQYSLPYSCVSGLSSGQHMILPKNTVLGSFPVVCDMDTDGGGWIVFQRRFDGSVDFSCVWDDYETGFGNPDGEFWLGLDKLHVLTSRGQWEFRVDLQDFDLNNAYAIYDNFSIGDSSSFYRLDIGSYSGTAGDSMRRHDLNGMAFTTKDQDHDLNSGKNCAYFWHSGWWHNACTLANLNGLYHKRLTGGMYWATLKSLESLKKSELKIRLIEG